VLVINLFFFPSPYCHLCLFKISNNNVWTLTTLCSNKTNIKKLGKHIFYCDCHPSENLKQVVLLTIMDIDEGELNCSFSLHDLSADVNGGWLWKMHNHPHKTFVMWMVGDYRNCIITHIKFPYVNGWWLWKMHEHPHKVSRVECWVIMETAWNLRCFSNF
jgi:hypothetical protein